MPCYRCGRMQTDPARGTSPWARAVKGGNQVLVCPECQRVDERWAAALDRCPVCGSTRLRVVLGSVVCRQCDADWPAHPEPGEGRAPGAL